MSYGLEGMFDNVQIARVARGNLPRSGAPQYLPPFDRMRLNRGLRDRGRRVRRAVARHFNASGFQGYDDDAQLEGLFSFIGRVAKGIGKGIFGAVKGVAKGVGFVGKTIGKGAIGLGKGIYQVGKFAVPLAAGAVLGFNPFGGGGQQQVQQPQSPIYLPYPGGPTGGGQMPGYPPYLPPSLPRPTIFGGPTQAPQPIFFPESGGGGGGGGGTTPLFTTPQGGQVYEGAPPSDGMSSALPLMLAGVAAVLLLSRR